MQNYGSPGKELKETVNQFNKSAPSKQGRAVAWALGASRRASALSSPRHFCPAFPNLLCSIASPWSPPGSPVHPSPESPDLPRLSLPTSGQPHLSFAAGPGVSAGSPAARSSLSTEALRLLLRGRGCFWAAGSGSMSGVGGRGGPVPRRPIVAGTVPASFCEAASCFLAEFGYRHHPGI